MKFIGFLYALMSLLLYFLLGTSNAQVVRLAGNHPATAPAVGVPEAPSDMQLSLDIGFAVRHKEDLDSLTRQQNDPASPMYHHALGKGEFEARFGPTSDEYQAVADWLKSYGFKITSGPGPLMYLWCQGTVAQAEAAFQVRIVMLSGGSYWNVDDPAVPGRFSGVIESIVGLDNLNALRKHFKSSSGQVGFGPGDLRTFYGLQPLVNAGIDGTGTDCIALPETSDFLDDATSKFDGTFGLPPLIRGTSAFKVVFVDNNTNPGKTSAAEEKESLLDIEWAHATAPGAPLTVYIGDAALDGAATIAALHAIQQAVSDNSCGTISISSAPCFTPPLDPNNPPTLITQLKTAFASAATHMQSVFVASGDDGVAGSVLNPTTMECQTGSSANVEEEAADTNVTAVGGTQFQPSYDASGNDMAFVAESVWNQPNIGADSGASGGGESVLTKKPSYQTGLGVPTTPNRDVPDVSMLAGLDPNAAGGLGPGVFIGDEFPFQSGTGLLTCCTGGTSLGAPIWAGISRLMQEKTGARVGNINLKLYPLGGLGGSAGIRDVKTGNNSFNGVTGFSAGVGYDQATGWGTIDIGMFVNAFVVSKALVTGGANTRSGETYDPASGSFTATGNMAAIRTLHSATLLDSGLSLIAGGANSGPSAPSATSDASTSPVVAAFLGNPISTTSAAAGNPTILAGAELYNPSNRSFSTTGAMVQPTENQRAVLLNNGKVLIAGGDGGGCVGCFSSAELYDPSTGKFSSTGTMAHPRCGATATLLADGKVLVAGGVGNGSNAAPKTAELYDPNTGLFTATGSMHTGRSAHVAALLENGTVLVAGGASSRTALSSAEIYDPSSGTFALTGNMSVARDLPTATLLPNGKVLIAGGCSSLGFFCSTAVASGDVYDPSAGTFSPVSNSMTSRRFAAAASLLNNGKVVVSGGLDSNTNSVVSTADLYDPSANSFSGTGSMNTARDFFPANATQ